MVVQGRELSAGDIGQMQGLLAEYPDWGRTRLSEEICRRWDWRNAPGRPKDMAVRTLLLKLERSGHIRLPPGSGLRPTGSEIAACQLLRPQPSRSAARCATCGLCP